MPAVIIKPMRPSAIINRFRRDPVASAGRYLERARARYAAAEEAVESRSAALRKKAAALSQRAAKKHLMADNLQDAAAHARRVAKRIADFLS